MKKTFLAALSLCIFTAFSANAKNQASDLDTKENSRRAAIEKVPACQNILNQCKQLGFVAGGYKEGNGLWRNCFQPTLHGKSASLKGKEVSVAVNANDVSSCKASAKEHLKDVKLAAAHEMKTDKKAARKAKAEGAATSTTVTQ